MSERPDRGGAWDFGGRVRPEYAPRRNHDPDPGEVVWAWVPYEEDPAVGKDRPMLVIGRDDSDAGVLVGLMLSTKDHDGDRDWMAVGAGSWDPEHRASWVRLDRPLGVRAAAVRREGASVPPATFRAVVERAVGASASGVRAAATTSPSPGARRGGLLGRLRSALRPHR